MQLTIGVILLLVVLPAVTYGLRVPLANLAVSYFLAEREIDGSLRVTRLDQAGTEIAAVALPGLVAEQLSVEWLITPWPVDFQLLAVELQAPKITVHLDEEPLWPLMAHLPTSSHADASASSPWERLPLVPPMTINKGEILLLSGKDQADISLNTAITGTSSTPRKIIIDANLSGFDLTGQGQVTLDLINNRPTTTQIAVNVRHSPPAPTPASHLQLQGQATFEKEALTLDGEGKVQLDGQGMAKLATQIPQLAQYLNQSLPSDAHGNISLEIDGQGDWPLQQNLSPKATQPNTLNLNLTFSGQDLSWPGLVSEADVDWAGQLTKDSDARNYLWRPSKDLTFYAEQTEGRLLPEEIRTRLPEGLFTKQSLTLAMAQLLLDKGGKQAQLDDLILAAGDGAGDKLTAKGSAKLDLSQDIWAEADLESRLQLPAPWPGLENLDLHLTGKFHHTPEGSLLELREIDRLTVTSDPSHWPEQLDQVRDFLAQFPFGKDPLPLSLQVKATSKEQPSLTMFLEPDSLSFNSQTEIQLGSPLWENLVINISANGDRTPTGQLLLDLPALNLESQALHSPYGRADISLSGSGSYLEDFFTGDFTTLVTAAQIDLPQGNARNVRLDLPLSASGTLQEIFWQTETATASIETLKAANQVRISPVKLTLKKGSGRIAGNSLTSKLDLALSPTTLHHPSQTLEVGPGQAVLDLASQAEGHAQVSFEHVTAQQAQVMISKPNFVLSRSEVGDLVMALQQAQLTDLSDNIRFPDLNLTGRTVLREQRISLEMEGRLPQASDSPLTVVGEYRLDRNQGDVDFELTNIVFDQDLQPKDLHASLKPVSEVEGTLSLSGSAALSPDGLADSKAELTLLIDKATTPFGEISTLSVPLALTSLWPLESAPDQQITLDRFEQGLAVEDLFLRYQLERQPDAQSPIPVLAVDKAQARLLGGQIILEPGRFNPLDKDQNLLLTAQDLDLVTVLSLISKEGLTGTGELEGRIPLELRDGDIIINGAHLRAESPGHLAFSSPPTDQALSTGGDHVQLLLSALENFHYTDLLLELDKEPGGQSRLLLKMEGSNPDLYDGYPFSLNLNLETAAAPLLSALATGSSLYDELIKRAVENR